MGQPQGEAQGLGGLHQALLVDDGKMMEAVFVVDDVDAFYQTWTGRRRYRRAERQNQEIICAEGNRNLFDYGIPVADKPDF